MLKCILTTDNTVGFVQMSIISQQILEDVESLPEQFQSKALDFIQFLKLKISKNNSMNQTGEPNGAKLAKLMAEASKKNLFSEIKDPVAWQREIRKDRPLPGRE